MQPVSPEHHDLTAQLHEFETAIGLASIERLLKATHVIASLRERTAYHTLYQQSVQTGFFLSELGELLRTTACTENEESRHWENITVNPSVYAAVLESYTVTINILNDKEKKLLPYAGLLRTYLQAIRFTTDYLNNDLYYQTADADHNLHRAFNQLILLEQMENVHPLPADWK